jgi:hypothetical protein
MCEEEPTGPLMGATKGQMMEWTDQDYEEGERLVRAFCEKYLLPGLQEAARNGEDKKIALYAMIEMLGHVNTWLFQDEIIDPCEELEDFINPFLKKYCVGQCRECRITAAPRQEETRAIRQGQ